MDWTDDVASFLRQENLCFTSAERSGITEFTVEKPDGSGQLKIDAVPVCSESLTEAGRMLRVVSAVRLEPGNRVFLAQDLWMVRGEMSRKRILAQLGRFRPVFARNTEVRRVARPVSGGFLSRWHTYGDVAARYCYGVFGKDGGMVAAASFSSPRRWLKDSGYIRSYEWVRYASLPDVRVIGGMGKVLAAFIRDVEPDDVMSYADLEWTDGSVYDSLGFVKESFRSPVLFSISPDTWRRVPCGADHVAAGWYHYNMGSMKYRLTL